MVQTLKGKHNKININKALCENEKTTVFNVGHRL